MDAWRDARDAFAANLPDRHLGFFQDLRLSFTCGDYFFAHAGAQPGTPLDAQSERDLMWIRKEFLEDERGFDRIVVHGHTPAENAYADHRRVGLDTGAYMTGVLTACRFEGEERRLFQAVETPGGPPEIRSSEL
jgi:serine/threonine protein phosphatase 1